MHSKKEEKKSGADPKKDKKKVEELSDEDKALKSEIEYLVEKIRSNESNFDKNKHIQVLFEKIKTRPSSRTTVPKELKFLQPLYESLVKAYNDMSSDSSEKKQFADLLSYASMTLAENYQQDSLRFFQQGSGSLDIKNLGDEYMLNLTGDIASEYENRMTSGQPSEDLYHLAQNLLPLLFKNGHEINAVDLLLELEKLEYLDKYVDDENYARIVNYLAAYIEYTADAVEFQSVLQRIYALAKLKEDPWGVLKVAVRLNDREKAIEALKMAKDRTVRLQLAFGLGRARMYFTPEKLKEIGIDGDEKFTQAMSNTLYKDFFQQFMKELDVLNPKKPTEIYKNMVENKDVGVTSNLMNLGDSFVNGLVNLGSGKDALLVNPPKDNEVSWISQVKEAEALSTIASLGLIYLWNFEEGQAVISEYLDLNDGFHKAGACIAVGLSNSGIWNENEPSKALLLDTLESKDPIVKTGSLVGLGLSYAGSGRKDFDEPFISLINNETFGVEVSVNAAIALAIIHTAECNSDITESILTSINLYNEEVLKKPIAKFFALALGINFLGAQEKCEDVIQVLTASDSQISRLSQIAVEACAYIGSGNVLKLQSFIEKARKGPEEDHEVQAMALIGAALVGVSEPVGTSMILRMVQHVLQYATGEQKRAVPIVLTIVGIVNPTAQLTDMLYKLAFEEDQELAIRAIIGMGLTYAGSNNSRVAELLRSLASYYSVEADKSLVYAVKLSLAFLFAGKGLVTLTPFYSDRFLHSKVGFSGILVACFLLLDAKELVTKNFHYLLYYLTLSFNPKMLYTLNEELESIKVGVRVGQAVDTVAQVGKPRRITGFQTFTSPVVVGIGDRAELSTEEYMTVLNCDLEHFVILKKNPDYVEEEKKKK